MEQKTLTKTQTGNIGNAVIKRIEELAAVGFSMPKDYSYANAIKASMLTLQSVKDRNGKPALEVCTPASIQSALFEMCIKGLNAAKKQAYFIVRGNVLCLDDSYFGKVLQVKRIYPKWQPNVNLIYEGDVFEYAVDAETGRKKIIKHEQKLENIDKDFVGAYMYLPAGENGEEKDLFIMSKRQILTNWAKSSNKSQMVHKEFRDKMVQKSVVNSGCNMIINSTPELTQTVEIAEENKVDIQDVEAEEIIDVPEALENATPITEENVDKETGEVKQPKHEVTNEEADF